MHRLNWDDLRLFLAVARAGRLASAGRALGLDHTTVARRLTGLETAMGARLFDRTPRGAAPTPAGLALIRHAERIEAEVMAADASLSERDAGASGTVRLATPEALGTFLIAPNVGQLHESHPDIRLELVPESRTVSLSQREADLAVSLSRPPKGRLVARKLVDYRLGVFAAQAYLDRRPPIRTVEDLRRERLVWYIDEMIDIPELRYLDQVLTDAPVAFRSSSIAAQQAAVASGFGLGVLHVFAAQQDKRLVRILADQVEITRSYWLVRHADQQRLPRVRAVADFLERLVADHRREF